MSESQPPRKPKEIHYYNTRQPADLVIARRTGTRRYHPTLPSIVRLCRCVRTHCVYLRFLLSYNGWSVFTEREADNA